MSALVFTVRGEPKSKGSLRARQAGDRIALVEAVEGSGDWRALVAWAAYRAAREGRWCPIGRPDPVRVDATFRFRPRGRNAHPTSRSTYDSDKLARNLLDALQDAEVIEDDSQVVDLHVRKAWTQPGESPGVCVRVSS